MTSAAVLLELTLVRIGMARRARCKCDSGIARLPVRARSVALRATHLRMCPGQGKARLCMIEAVLLHTGLLPVRSRVAPRAIGSESALVLVLVAGGAACVQPHVGVVQVLVLQRPAKACAHVARIVATSTPHTRMLSVEHISCLRVIESACRRRPVHNGEILSVVLGVALDTRRARSACLRIIGVQPTVLLQLGGNLPMAVQAEEGSRAHPGRMAPRAVSRPVKRLVRARQRSGRDLRRGAISADDRQQAHRDSHARAHARGQTRLATPSLAPPPGAMQARRK